MKTLWIIFGILVGLLVILLAALFLGKAKIKIRIQNTVKVVFSVGGLRFWLYPMKYDAAENQAEARWIKKNLVKRRQKRKKEQADRAAGKPVPNMLDNLQTAFSLIKQAREHIGGKLHISVHRFHLRVAANDAAQTAILYGAVVGIASTMMQWIHTHIAPIERNKKAITVTPDYVTGQSDADVDIVLNMSLFHALIVISHMYDAYREEQEKAIFRATRRLAAKQAREERRAAARLKKEELEAAKQAAAVSSENQ